MTKQVRIENADTNTSFKVRVRVEDQVYGPEGPTGEWETTETHELPYPTQLTSLYLTSSRRLVVEEYT